MTKKNEITPEIKKLLTDASVTSKQIASKTGLSLSWVQKYRQSYRNIPEKNNLKAQAILGRFTESERIKDYAAEIGEGNPVTVRKMEPHEHAEFVNIHAINREAQAAVTGYIIGSIYKRSES